MGKKLWKLGEKLERGLRMRVARAKSLARSNADERWEARWEGKAITYGEIETRIEGREHGTGRMKKES